MVQASAEKLELTGSSEKERVVSVPQRERLASTPEPPLPKGKRNKDVSPKYQIMRERESRWARAAPWRERGRSEREHEEERVDSTVKEGRFQRGKSGQTSLPKRGRRKHQRLSGCKSYPARSV